MKLLLIALVLMISYDCAMAQPYYVTHVTGKVLIGKSPLKSPATLNDLSHLLGERTARVSLFSPLKGHLNATFVKGKAVIQPGRRRSSEFFEIVIKDNIFKESGEKVLTSKGDFDLFTFFDQGDSPKVLIIVGQTLTAQSSRLRLKPSDQIAICKTDVKDSICVSLRRDSENIHFDKDELKTLTNTDKTKSVTLRVKLLYDSESEYFPKPVYFTFMSLSDFGELVNTYKKGLNKVYGNDPESLISELESELSRNFGVFDEAQLHRLILEYLNH